MKLHHLKSVKYGQHVMADEDAEKGVSFQDSAGKQAATDVKAPYAKEMVSTHEHHIFNHFIVIVSNGATSWAITSTI